MSSNPNIDYAHRVPPELFQPIIQSIRSQADLAAIALCCKDFSSDAQAQLFKNPFAGERSARAHCRFLDAVILSPHRLALHVRSYCQVTPQFTQSGISQYRRENNPDYDRLIEQTRVGLPLMKNLKHLEYRPFSRSSMDAAGIVLQQCTFAHLESLDWWCQGAERYLVEKVFPAHPKLKHLGVVWVSGVTAQTVVPSHLLRRLDSLRGGWSTFTAFMPGRNVTRLPWKRRSVHNEVMILGPERLGEELVRVRYLAYDFPGPEMIFTLRALPDLEELELFVTSSGNAKSQLNSINVLKKLTALVITARDGFPVDEYLEEETHREIAAIAFAVSSTLEYIDIDSGDAVYSRYRAVRKNLSGVGSSISIIKVEL
ncbi:hypothetical protein D9619_013324 [Psilocybe cf. subviscida]|uniref:Uncharacterized protein n=1 Tax=Psilocybe cf. subviscida TaxID=2480587 RepID=A0A8H5BTT0_9AGAR|nr:hypothetical protein D9619_013324 [Psilocybe cf. subviscida]